MSFSGIEGQVSLPHSESLSGTVLYHNISAMRRTNKNSINSRFFPNAEGCKGGLFAANKL